MKPSTPRAVRGLLSMAIAASLLAMSVTPTAAWSESVYVAAYGVDQEQKTKCNCVPASARYWIRYTRSEASTPSQQTLGNYMAYPKDRNDFWDTGSYPCTIAEGNPYWSTPHDAQGWAWAMYNYATTDHSKGYDDYLFSSQATANWQIVWNVRATDRPVGVIVKAGKHAILAVGYTTDYDPWKPQVSEIYGFRVWDPWHGRGDSIGFNNYPAAGYEGNEYISLATWNQYIFKKDTNEGQFYNDKYILVLQKATATQPGTAEISYGEYVFNQQQLLAAPSGADAMQEPLLEFRRGGQRAPTQAVSGTETDQRSIEEALEYGLRIHGLVRDEQMALDLTGYSVGRVVNIAALDSSTSPYNLSELWVRNELRAIALTWQRDNSHTFGALVKAAGSIARLPSSDDLSSALAANDMTGPGRLVWSLNTTDEANSFFYPFIAGRDASTGLDVYLTSTGPRNPTDPLH